MTRPPLPAREPSGMTQEHVARLRAVAGETTVGIGACARRKQLLEAADFIERATAPGVPVTDCDDGTCGRCRRCTAADASAYNLCTADIYLKGYFVGIQEPNHAPFAFTKSKADAERILAALSRSRPAGTTSETFVMRMACAKGHEFDAESASEPCPKCGSNVLVNTDFVRPATAIVGSHLPDVNGFINEVEGWVSVPTNHWYPTLAEALQASAAPRPAGTREPSEEAGELEAAAEALDATGMMPGMDVSTEDAEAMERAVRVMRAVAKRLQSSPGAPGATSEGGGREGRNDGR